MSSVTCEETIDGGAAKVTYPLPDKDVSGIGIIISYLLSADVAWFLITAMYILGHIPADRLNNCDRLFFRVRSKNPDRWAKLLTRGVMSLSDLQIVTGITILIDGFANLDTMSIFEFQSVIYLAWLASNVHLSTLIFLRDRLIANQALLAIRLTGMIILLGMLFGALYPTREYTWAGTLMFRTSCPHNGVCLPLSTKATEIFSDSTRTRTSPCPQGPISYVILAVSYFWRIVMVFEPLSAFFRGYLRTPPLRGLEARIGRLVKRRRLTTVKPESIWKSCAHVIQKCWFMGLYIFFLALLDVFGSFAVALGMLLIGLAWAVFELFAPRRILPDCVKHALNTWDYGQILALLVLLLPLYVAAQNLFDETESKRRDSHAIDDTRLRNGSRTSPHITVGSSWWLRWTRSPADDTTNRPKDAQSPTKAITISDLFEACANSDPPEEDTRAAVQSAMYTTIPFRLFMTLLWVIALGASISFFTQTYLSFETPELANYTSEGAIQPLYDFNSVGWGIAPTVVGIAGSLVLAFSVAIICAFWVPI